LFIIGALLVVVVLLPRERWALAWRARLAALGAARVHPSRGVP
jgi:hypothetical protein